MSKRTAALAAAKEAAEQAIGVTRGGRNSKLHALVDKFCRPWVIILTPGNVAECTVRPQCVGLVTSIETLLGDKAYDSDQFRGALRQDGIAPVIPGRANRKNAYDTTRKPIRAATSLNAVTADLKNSDALPRVTTSSPAN
jgi:transposase